MQGPFQVPRRAGGQADREPLTSISFVPRYQVPSASGFGRVDHNPLMQNVVERVINLLIYLLDSPYPVTADQVRQTVAGYGEQRDEAFHRMFERDKDLLKRMGVPLKLKASDKWEIDFGYTSTRTSMRYRIRGSPSANVSPFPLRRVMVRLGAPMQGWPACSNWEGLRLAQASSPSPPTSVQRLPCSGPLPGRQRQRNWNLTTRPPAAARPLRHRHRRGHWYLIGQTSDGERVYRVDRISSFGGREAGGGFFGGRRNFR